MDEITIGDKTYISSKRAAEITGYAKDYVGQLCREGHVEARMVGRGWYVYEPSIRAHRFGPETPTPEPPAEPVKVSPELPSTWERPVYTPEPVTMLPELDVVTDTAPEPVQEAANDTLTDMQSAWREWFDRKQTPVTEPPAVSEGLIGEETTQSNTEIVFEAAPVEDEPTYEEEISIPLHKIEPEQELEEEENAEEAVPIHRVRPPAPKTEPRTSRKQVKTTHAPRRTSQGSHAAITAFLVVISLLSILILVIGSGYADGYLKTLVGNNAVVNFLVGNSVFIR